MRITQSMTMVVLMFAALFTLLPTAKATAWNQKTYLDVKQPIQIPNHKELLPGKYVVKLLDSRTDGNLVEFFNADESRLITLVQAIPDYRVKVTHHTALGWYETPAGQPPALRSWFYPGSHFGQEFAPYVKTTEMASASQHMKPAVKSGS